MNDTPVTFTSRIVGVLLTLSLSFLAASCVSEVQQLTEEHGDEMRAAFARYFEITQGHAAYGDREALREVVTARQLEMELFSPDAEVHDVLVYYEIKDFQVLEYSPVQARIVVHWAAWHHNVNIVTGEEWPVNLLEIKETCDFVKEDGKWKVDRRDTVERYWPPHPW